MSASSRRIPGVILLAEDDPGDQKLIRRAFATGPLDYQLKVVEDGDELVDYLTRSGKYTDVREAPRPSLVLLDLNMPKKDGRAALREIKSHRDLRRIPVVVLTTSDQEIDIIQCYDLGANSYITKPSSFPELAQMAEQLESYWFELSRTPYC
ncbi:MAG: response regulator [Kiloniellales bacterium]|nr:response regulator [Kiloniellales bacterium]